MSQLEGERLDSWKEIAAYLDRDLRTVRRWEKEKGLPVRRVPGGERSAVFAYPEEIDKWMQSGGAKLEANAIQGGQLAPQVKIETPTRLGPSHGLITLSIALAIVLAAVFAFSMLAGRGGDNGRRDTPGINAVEASAESDLAPVITTVTAIGPIRDQPIRIVGHGFGVHTGYRNQDTPYLAIRDNTAHWAAGRIIPVNWDEVTLNVASWTDSEIIVTGFSGAYGKRGWKLSVGDEIEVAVWNPQTRAGPGIYHLRVTKEFAP
jgi:hypothetical protein